MYQTLEASSEIGRLGMEWSKLEFGPEIAQSNLTRSLAGANLSFRDLWSASIGWENISAQVLNRLRWAIDGMEKDSCSSCEWQYSVSLSIKMTETLPRGWPGVKQLKIIARTPTKAVP